MTRYVLNRSRQDDQTANFAHFVRADVCKHRAGARQFLRLAPGPIRENQRLMFRVERCKDCGAKLQSIEE